MRPVIFAVLLLSSGPAWSGWVQMSSEAEGSVMYADPDTLKVDGQVRQILELHDLKAPDKVRGHRSARVLTEYDCKEARIRLLREEYFSGQMGGGERLGGTTEPTGWFTLSPGTRGWNLMKFVCSR